MMMIGFRVSGSIPPFCGNSAAKGAWVRALGSKTSNVVPDEAEAGEHFEGYLATIELHWKKRRFEQLKEEVTGGTVPVTDQRWHEFQQLAKDLAKGEG